MKKIVLDASILVKVFISEEDSSQAKDLLNFCFNEDIEIILPEFYLYEILHVVVKNNLSILAPLDILKKYESLFTKVIKPDKKVWLLAEKISQSGHEKSGYPSLYDSVYHALALENSAVLITADKRHYEKTKNFGSIILLENWKNIF